MYSKRHRSGGVWQRYVRLGTGVALRVALACRLPSLADRVARVRVLVRVSARAPRLRT